jgi:hypothetical protein
VYRQHLVALHGFIKKIRTTPVEEPALASEGVDAVSKKNMGSGIGEFLQEQEEGVLAAAQTQAVAEVVQAMKGKEDFEESDGFASEDQPDSGGPIVGWGGRNPVESAAGAGDGGAAGFDSASVVQAESKPTPN